MWFKKRKEKKVKTQVKTQVKTKKSKSFVLDVSISLNELRSFSTPLIDRFQSEFWFVNSSGRGYSPTLFFDKNFKFKPDVVGNVEEISKSKYPFAIEESDDDMDFTEWTFYYKGEKLFKLFYACGFSRGITFKFPKNTANEDFRNVIGRFQPNISNIDITIAYSYLKMIETLLNENKKFEKEKYNKTRKEFFENAKEKKKNNLLNINRN